MRSLREPKALTIQPMRCRSDQNMAQILSKRRQQNSSKSFILRVHDVLMRDTPRRAESALGSTVTASAAALIPFDFAAHLANLRVLKSLVSIKVQGCFVAVGRFRTCQK